MQWVLATYPKREATLTYHVHRAPGGQTTQPPFATPETPPTPAAAGARRPARGFWLARLIRGFRHPHNRRLLFLQILFRRSVVHINKRFDDRVDDVGWNVLWLLSDAIVDRRAGIGRRGGPRRAARRPSRPLIAARPGPGPELGVVPSGPGPSSPNWSLMPPFSSTIRTRQMVRRSGSMAFNSVASMSSQPSRAWSPSTMPARSTSEKPWQCTPPPDPRSSPTLPGGHVPPPPTGPGCTTGRRVHPRHGRGLSPIPTHRRIGPPAVLWSGRPSKRRMGESRRTRRTRRRLIHARRRRRCGEVAGMRGNESSGGQRALGLGR